MSLAISQYYVDSVRATIKNKLYIGRALSALLFMRRMNKNELELNASAQSATLTKMHSDVVESQWASEQLFAMSKASRRAKWLEFVVQTFHRTIPGETPALYSMHLWKTSEKLLKGVVNSSDCFSYDSYENCINISSLQAVSMARVTRCHDHACIMLCSTSSVTKRRFCYGCITWK